MEPSTDPPAAQGTELDASWAFLKEFSLKEFKGLAAAYVASTAKRGTLRTALMAAYGQPWVPAGWVPPPRVPAGTTATSTASVVPSAAAAEATSSPEPAQGQAGYASEVLLGVVAGDIKLGVRALRDWCWALGVPYVQPVSRVDGTEQIRDIRGGVYIKYNSKTLLSYVTQYTGKDRGVLIQMGSEQLGHFPLGLMDEAMSNPTPQL